MGTRKQLELPERMSLDLLIMFFKTLPMLHGHVGAFKVKVLVFYSALCLFAVNAVLPLEAPPVPGWRILFCQILVRGFRSRRAGSCGCEIVLSQVRVAAGVLLDGGHPQAPCAVRGEAAVQAGGQGAAAGCGRGPDLAQLLRQGGGRGPAGEEGGRLDDAHGR